MTEKNNWFNKLWEATFPDEKVIAVTPVSGGDINESFCVRSTNQCVFLKRNKRDRYPNMFKAEVHGLQELNKVNLYRVPEVHHLVNLDSFVALIMEYIPLTHVQKGADTGRAIAEMHKLSNEQFGLGIPNYIGTLEQLNDFNDGWWAFYITQRIEPRIKSVFEKGLLNRSDIQKFDKLAHRFTDFYPEESPALLHGDLWSGNVAEDDAGKPVLFDPAVYYGHREIDIAMTRLFGGFSESFYSAYNEHNPLDLGWVERIPIGQLYPLLVHLDLFGQAYTAQIQAVLKRFIY